MWRCVTHHASTGKPKCLLDQRHSLSMDNIQICWLLSNKSSSLSPPLGLIQVNLISHLFLQGTVLCDSNLSRCSGDSECWSTTFAACAIYSRIVGPRTWDGLWWRSKTQHVNIKFGSLGFWGYSMVKMLWRRRRASSIHFQSINQSINHLINQSVSQSVCLSINQETTKWLFSLHVWQLLVK